MIYLILLCLLSAATAVWLGNDLSKELPEFHEIFDCRPFNCRPCLSFHLTWIFATFFACCICSLKLILMGVVAAFVVFIVLKIMDNKMIEK